MSRARSPSWLHAPLPPPSPLPALLPHARPDSRTLGTEAAQGSPGGRPALPSFLPKPPGRRGPGRDCQPRGDGLRLAGDRLEHHGWQGRQPRPALGYGPGVNLAVTGDLFCGRGESRPRTRDGTSRQLSGARRKHNHLIKGSKIGKQKYCSWHTSTSILIQCLTMH